MDGTVKKQPTRVRHVVAVKDPVVRRRELTRSRILEVALELIDEADMKGCTMQALATRLGVTPRALYRHVADKVDLLRGVADLVLSDVVLPESSRPWDDRLRQLGTEIKRVMDAHPHTVMLCGERALAFPGVIPTTDVAIEAVVQAGLPPEEGIRFGHALYVYTLGFCISAAGSDMRRRDVTDHTDLFAGVETSLVPHAVAAAGFLRHFAAEGLHKGHEQYLYGLDLLISGLRTMVEANKPAGSSRGH